jgi:response regulator of citrate/malate metabolism
MTNQNSNEELKKYLITEAVDIKQLSQEKVDNDLLFLEKYEEKSKVKTDISRGVKDKNLSRVMKALQLTNPFKGY